MSDTPFNPSNADPAADQSTLATLLTTLSQNCSREMRVCLPCEVVNVRGNQLVDLQPLLQVNYYAAVGPTTLPVIPHCPVSMPSGKDWSVKWPLAVGDTGYAIFCDRSLDNWMAGQGGVVDPQEARTHQLTDAIFVPGLVPTAKQTQDQTQDLVMRNGTAQVRLEKNGTFRIANDGQELVDLVGQLSKAVGDLVMTLQQAQTITMLGPSPFWGLTQSSLASAGVAIEQLSANLQTLRGS